MGRGESHFLRPTLQSLALMRASPDIDHRPVLLSEGTKNGVQFFTNPGYVRSSRLFLSHLTTHSNDQEAVGSSGFRIMGDFEHVWISGCTSTGFEKPFDIGSTGTDLRMVGNVSIPGVRTSHSQNYYVSKVSSLIASDNIGLNPLWAKNRSEGTIFGHGWYIQFSVGSVQFDNNIILDAQSHGYQFRNRETVADSNLAIRCPIGYLFGYHGKEVPFHPIEVTDCYTAHAGDIRPEVADLRGIYKRGEGFWFENATGRVHGCGALAPRTRRSTPTAIVLNNTSIPEGDEHHLEIGSFLSAGYPRLSRLQNGSNPYPATIIARQKQDGYERDFDPDREALALARIGRWPDRQMPNALISNAIL